MKRFITLSLFACLLPFADKAWACAGGDDGPYVGVFNIYMHDYKNLNGERLARFWAAYTGDRKAFSKEWAQEWRNPWDYFFEKDCERLFAAAKKRRDEEMLLYLRQTLKYNRISEDIKDSWEYPTAQDLAERRKTLLIMQRAAKAYGGQRLQAQYSLLYMRANLLLKDYRANQDFWVLKASKYPESVFKDMMHSLYANAILNQGQWRKACDIYVQQGDWESVEWAMRNYTNPAGIKRIYKEDPNSPTLAYLLQYYINGGYGYDHDYDNPFTSGKNASGPREEAKAFIDFIQTDVLQNPNVRDKAMWKSAQAMMLFSLRSFAKAQKYAETAEKLNGTKRAKDIARSVAFLASTHCQPLNETYSRYVVGEVQWLLGRAKQRKPADDLADGEYYHAAVLDEVVNNNLIPRYEKETDKNKTLALYAMMDDILPEAQQSVPEGRGDVPYSWSYEVGLDTLTSDKIQSFYRYLQSSPADPLLRYALSVACKNADYFNNLIGTAYLREGKFAEAIPFLEKVDLGFLKRQGYCDGTVVDDFVTDQWFKRRPYPQVVVDDAPLKENPRLLFCREMLSLQSRYRLARNKEVQAEVAYTMASRYFQASSFGDCGCLTSNGITYYEITEPYEMDFPEQALTLLKQGAASKKADLKLKCLFAMAHISYAKETEWRLLGPGSWFSFLDNKAEIVANYTTLAKYVKGLKTAPDYITNCDILREFIATQLK